MAEQIKAKANEAIREINRKAVRLRVLAARMPSPKIDHEAQTLLNEITKHLHVLDDIITELLATKEQTTL